MELFRLDSVAPAVAERFRQTSSSKRREAVRVACQHAAATVGLAAQEVSEALAVLRGAAAPDVSLRERLESFAADFDDQYFRLDEDGDAAQKQEALRLFSKARATSALAFALSADEAHLHEAIYEAISAMDEPAELVRLVEGALG